MLPNDGLKIDGNSARARDARLKFNILCGNLLFPLSKHGQSSCHVVAVYIVSSRHWYCLRHILCVYYIYEYSSNPRSKAIYLAHYLLVAAQVRRICDGFASESAADDGRVELNVLWSNPGCIRAALGDWVKPTGEPQKSAGGCVRVINGAVGRRRDARSLFARIYSYIYIL